MSVWDLLVQNQNQMPCYLQCQNILRSEFIFLFTALLLLYFDLQLIWKLNWDKNKLWWELATPWPMTSPASNSRCPFFSKAITLIIFYVPVCLLVALHFAKGDTCSCPPTKFFFVFLLQLNPFLSFPSWLHQSINRWSKFLPSSPDLTCSRPPRSLSQSRGAGSQ